MSAGEWLCYVALALLLGTAGQLVRVGVGFKKLHDQHLAKGDPVPFDAQKFWTSIVLGAAAGLLTALVKWKGSATIELNFIFTLMAAGYAGSDIVEGLIDKAFKKAP